MTKGQVIFIIILALWPGFLFCQISNVEVIHTNNSLLPSNTIWDVEVDHAGTWWVATQEGLYTATGEDILIYTEGLYGLSENDIRSVCIKEDNIWIGGFQTGLYKIEGNVWPHYTTENNLPSNYIKDIAIYSDNRLALATSGGIGEWNGQEWIQYNNQNTTLVSTNITSVKYDLNGTLWAGCINGGLYKRVNEKESQLWTNVNSSLFDNTISDLAIDNLGQIWLASPYAGLQLFNGLYFLVFNSQTSAFPYHSASSVNAYKDGIILVGTNDQGLFIYDYDHLYPVSSDYFSQISSDDITSLAWENDSVILAGTLEGGLLKITLSLPLSIATDNIVINSGPNPCMDKLFLRASAPITAYNITDISGHSFYTNIPVPLFENNLSIDVSLLNKGLYHLQYKINDRWYHEKFIKF